MTDDSGVLASDPSSGLTESSICRGSIAAAANPETSPDMLETAERVDTGDRALKIAR